MHTLGALEVRIIVALLARRLVELFLNIGIRIGFGSFGIWIGMAGPVIANGFRRRGEARRRRGIVLLLRISPRHWQARRIRGSESVIDRKLKLESEN